MHGSDSLKKCSDISMGPCLGGHGGVRSGPWSAWGGSRTTTQGRENIMGTRIISTHSTGLITRV